MFKAFEKPIKLHIADAYNTYKKPVVYDADTIDTETDMFQTLYLVYGTLENPEDFNVEQLKTIGCNNPKLYNPKEKSNIEI